jgi:hypothetical protein
MSNDKRMIIYAEEAFCGRNEDEPLRRSFMCRPQPSVVDKNNELYPLVETSFTPHSTHFRKLSSRVKAAGYQLYFASESDIKEFGFTEVVARPLEADEQQAVRLIWDRP